MKVIVAGSRHCTDEALVARAIDKSDFEVTEVVSGCARGVDTLGERWANAHKIPIKHFPALWAIHHRAAGPIRNREMAGYADALVAIYFEDSRGTANMIETAYKFGLKVYVYLDPGQSADLDKHPSEYQPISKAEKRRNQRRA